MFSSFKAATSLFSNSQNSNKKEQKTAYFNEILVEAGVSLHRETLCYVVSQEQALVSRDMTKILHAHINYPNNVQEFITGFRQLCTKEEFFNKALAPTELIKLNQDNQVKIRQESLIRIFLNVECLQTEVIQMLLEEITTCAPEDDEDTSRLRLLLNPLRYLSHIKDSKLLTTKLLDILEIATYAKQLEILNMIPEIIPDTEYEEVANQLSKLLGENEDLTGAIIDCLNSLNLTSDVRADIQERALSMLETSSSHKIFTIIFEFLITDCSSTNLQGTLMQARNVLDSIMSSEEASEEIESNKVLIFNRLQTLAIAKKNLCEGWINLIGNIRTAADHKPIDLLIIMMLHSMGKARKSTLDGLIRKKIKNGQFKISMVETLFKKYFVSQILKDYLNSIIQIAINLLRFYTDSLLVEFASTIIGLLFNHPLVDCTQRQEVIFNLIILIGTSDKKSVTPVLSVLTSLLANLSKLQQHSVQLMGLLEKLDAIDLKDVKSVFNLLCTLTCGEKANEFASGLKDEIHMVVRKQLSSSKKIVKHRGIVAAIVMAKILATSSEEQKSIEEEDSMTLEDIPQGDSQEAASLIMLANTCTLGNPDSVGLYYDQLATMLIESRPNLDSHFMAWLDHSVTNDFQNTFVTENLPDPIDDIPLTMQYSLNKSEEMECLIAIRVGELTLKSQYGDNRSILILAPIFRLLRLVHFRQHNGDLSTIDALLGCAVLMPNLEDIDNYDLIQLRRVADCIFHCINWFRETIGAFVKQKSKKLRFKVLERLANVVELEELLERCLQNIPDHKLPTSYFDVPSNQSTKPSPAKSIKVRRPKKKQKTAETTVNLEETIASTSAAPTQQPKSTVTKKKTTKDVNVDKICAFREMDTDIIALLVYPLKFENDSDYSIEGTQSNFLNIKQLIFLLNDLAVKLATSNKSKTLTLSHMTTINLGDLITDCLKLLPNIRNHLNVVTSNLEKVLKETDETLDVPLMFTTETNQLKICLHLLLKIQALVFAWSGFQHPSNLNLLKESLKVLRADPTSKLVSLKGLIAEYTVTLASYVKYCVYLPAAVSLIQILESLYSITPNPDMKKKIAVVSGKFLTKPWYNLNGDSEIGKNASLNIDILIKSYLSDATVKTICALVGTLQMEVSELKTKDDKLPTLGSINKTNFYLFYRCICSKLLETVRNEITSLTNNQHLVLWKTTALTMQGLMSVVKSQETKTNLITFLKNSIGILKVFLASGIPILEIMLRSKSDEVVEIFKIMQTSTRFLHQLCCYSKFTKDTGLVAYVPQFRLVLESLLYRVKAALVANNCSAAFWMGTLKNKDMHGEDLLSQTSEVSEATENTDELPPDDSEEEEVPTEAREVNAESDADSSGSDIF